MRAVNIYALTRDLPEEAKPLFEKALSHRDGRLRIKEQEFEQIAQIVQELLRLGASQESFEDWYYSFTIPHVSREFDLLKAGENGCVVNVELKSASPSVTLARIRKQLERNQYYLSLIGSKIYSFTYLSDGKSKGRLYTLTGEGLKTCSFRELLRRLAQIRRPLRENIEERFRPGDFLISPFSEPERFCKGQYFLTEHQQQMRERILTGIRRSTSTLFGVTGEAGTGKTLLLYDIAKELSKDYKICVIHCGNLSAGHEKLKSMLKGIEVVEAGFPKEPGRDFEGEVKSSAVNALERCDVVCVDESQRLSEEEFAEVLAAYAGGKIKACLFVYDVKQVLSRSERERNMPEQLRRVTGFQELRLAKNIRTSKEIYAFINALLDLKKRSGLPFPNIDVLWAGDEKEEEKLIRFYQKRGYHYIPSGYENSHDVIGLEFDAVVVTMDERFHYTRDGKLSERENEEEDCLYVQLLYQNVSRTKDKLCVIVKENADVFRELVAVVCRNS